MRNLKTKAAGKTSRAAKAWKSIAHLFKSKPLAGAGVVIMLVLTLIAIFADVIAPVKMQAGTLPGNILYKLVKPFWMLSADDQAKQVASGTIYWLGTDNLGRDVLSYLIYGARTSVVLCLGVSVLSTAISVLIGTLSATLGGWFDLIVQRVVDAFQCIPGMLFSLIIMNMLGNGMMQLIIVMSVPGGIANSRMIRSSAIAIRNSGYVRSSELLGAAALWKMAQHVLPNILPVIITTAAGGLGGTVMMEASLNFLGYGVPVGTPSWGYMITNQGRNNMFSAPYLCLFPGICITIMVLAANLFGDGLRDVMDPRLRGGVGTYDSRKIKKIAAKYARLLEESRKNGFKRKEAAH